MKNIKHIFVLLGLILGSISVISTESAFAESIVSDDFNTYTNGSIVGQGGWSSYVNGGNFIVQGTTVFESAKALYNNAQADSVIIKSGSALSDGNQTVYIRTENRSGWGTYSNGNAQVGISKGSWGGRQLRNFIAVSFKPDGNVAYYNPVSDAYLNFATYNDNEWTLLEFEWRSIDKKAHYKVNNGIWTDWFPFAGSGTFTDFDTVGFDSISLGGGGVYIDSLSLPLCTASSWSCTDWNSCSVGGTQTRSCDKISSCVGGVSTPATSQSCTPPPSPPTPTPTSSPTIIPATPATPATPAIPFQGSGTPAMPAISATPATPAQPLSPTLTPAPTTNNQPTILSLLDQIKILQSQISQLRFSQQKTSPTPTLLENTPNNTGIVMGSCAELINNLTYRSRDISTNGEVSTLQDFLQINGYLNSEPTGFFGILTLEAVKKFQRINNINPSAGFVGPITRTKIKELSCQ